jgi:hypothetical protein
MNKERTVNKALFFRRTTPFFLVSWLGLVAGASAAEPNGRWLFVDDGSGVEIAPCPVAADGLCGTLVQLPNSAASITPAERKQLCGVTMLGALKVGKPKKDELIRLEGWVIDPENLAKTAEPTRYDVSMVMTSDVRARLDVRGPLGMVLESHPLMRSPASAPTCK